jgi:streptomycin 6-kinase
VHPVRPVDTAAATRERRRVLVDLPRTLVAAAREEGRADWLDRLPAIVGDYADRWSLSVEAPFQPGGQTAWVAPARGARGEESVLKVMWRHPEAEHEPDGLRLWAGGGTVTLHAAAEAGDDTIVMLIERCRPGSALAEEPEGVQDEVIAGLLSRLWVEPPVGHGFRPLAEMCEWWARGFEATFDAKRAAGRLPLDPGLAAEGIGLFRSLPTTAPRNVLLCTDLHAGNVLRAEREPWLMIDPKPFVGDPTYDVLQHLLNCSARLSSDPDGAVSGLADLLELDRQRLRLWLFARCVQESPDWPNLADVARRLAPR